MDNYITLRWHFPVGNQDRVSFFPVFIGNFGFDAQNEEYGDMIKAGIIDPTKVTRAALQNASSVASLMLTTAVMISEIPEEDKKMPAMPGGGGMEGMY